MTELTMKAGGWSWRARTRSSYGSWSAAWQRWTTGRPSQNAWAKPCCNRCAYWT